jgi:hypothetical protein
MITLIITFVAMLIAAAVASLLISLNEVSLWIRDAEIEISEYKESPYVDNSEFDWGHNVRNYMEE